MTVTVVKPTTEEREDMALETIFNWCEMLRKRMELSDSQLSQMLHELAEWYYPIENQEEEP